MVGRTYASVGKEVDNRSAVARRDVKKCDIKKKSACRIAETARLTVPIFDTLQAPFNWLMFHLRQRQV